MDADYRKRLLLVSGVACSGNGATPAERAAAANIARNLPDTPVAFDAALALVRRGERPRESAVRELAGKALREAEALMRERA